MLVSETRARALRWLAVTLLLAGCGSEGKGAVVDPEDPPEEPPPAPVIDSALMNAFAGTSTNEMQVLLHKLYGGQHEATPNVFLLPAPGARAEVRGTLSSAPTRSLQAAMSACAPTETGVDTLGLAIDSDDDGIPDDYTVDFGTGCSQVVDGLEYTFEGKYRYQDIGGGVLDFSYTTTALSAMVRDTATGDFYRQRVSGTESAHFTESHAAHQMDVTLEVTSRNGGDSAHVTLRTNEVSIFDPDAGSSFERHGTLPQGTFGLASELTFRDLAAGTDSVRFVLSTPTPIHVAFACDTGFDAGKLQGLDEGDARVGFRFSWAGCGAPGFEIFGTTH